MVGHVLVCLVAMVASLGKWPIRVLCPFSLELKESFHGLDIPRVRPPLP